MPSPPPLRWQRALSSPRLLSQALLPVLPTHFPGPTVIGPAWTLCLSQSQSLWPRGGTSQVGSQAKIPSDPQVLSSGILFLGANPRKRDVWPCECGLCDRQVGQLGCGCGGCAGTTEQFQGHPPFPGGVTRDFTGSSGILAELLAP